MFALGFLAAGAVLARRLKELDKPRDWAYEIIFAGLIGGLVGARLYYLFQHSDQFSKDPLGSLFGGTGLVWYGGAIGGGAPGAGLGQRPRTGRPPGARLWAPPPARCLPERGLGRPGSPARGPPHG